MSRILGRRAGAGLALAVVLGLSVYAGAQTASSDATALAVPVSGRIVITDMGKAETHIVPTPVVSSGSTTQREDLDITLPVLGIPLEGRASLIMEAHMTMVLVSATTTAQGKADDVVLHGPAGDATVSVVIDQPVQGMDRPGSRCGSSWSTRTERRTPSTWVPTRRATRSRRRRPEPLRSLYWCT